MRNVSFFNLTSSEPKTGGRTESREQLRGVSYTVGAGEATVVCRKGERGKRCPRLEGFSARRGARPGEDLDETKLVGFVESSGTGVSLERKRERR